MQNFDGLPICSSREGEASMMHLQSELWLRLGSTVRGESRLKKSMGQASQPGSGWASNGSPEDL